MELIENIMIKAFNIWRAIVLFVLRVVLAILALAIAGVEAITFGIEGDFDGIVEEGETLIRIIKRIFATSSEEEEDTPE